MISPSLKEIFEPTTVAIVGASREPEKIGYVVLRNILDAEYKGKIFPVNPNAQEILGIRTYPLIEDVPIPVDLAVIAVPSKIVPAIMEQCKRKGVKGAIIISGGFREVGKEGEELERTVFEIAKVANIRILGPNCQGINNPHIGLCATWPLVKKKGPIGIITQSGTVGAALQCWADREGIGISKCINLGNKVDINEIDLLEYLEHDEATKVIALYIEGVTDGRKFIEAASRVSKKKPIIALKGGRTKAGLKAVLSHTKSLAGKDEIYDAVFKRTGIIRAESLEELYDFLKALSFLPLPKGRGVLIITTTGGSGILAADMCEKLGLALPEPSERAKSKLRMTLSSRCTFSNPFDLTAEGLIPDRFRLVVDENLDNDDIHAFITIFGDPVPGAAEEMRRAFMEIDKPIIVSYLGGGEIETIERNKMHSMGVPVFPSPERAVAALHALVKYSELLT